MLTVGILLTLFFGPRFVQSWKFMPGGLMAGLRYPQPVTRVYTSGFAVFKYSKELGFF
jgi:uncharacterized membrane protein (UPF0136 family)